MTLPWVNGSVEVFGKDLLWTFRLISSETQVTVDEWDAVLLLTEYAINHRAKDILVAAVPWKWFTAYRRQPGVT